MARAHIDAPAEAPDDGLANEQILASWQHVFQLLRKRPNRKTEPELLACANGGRRRSLPFVAMSPFGGPYFSAR